MIADSVAFLAGQGRRVFVDFEHFFDGYKRNPEFSHRVLEAAAVSGAEALVLCDTNGGSLPHEVERITRDVVSAYPELVVGMHTQNDTGCAVANAVAGVRAGSTHVQGTINGYGERTGNCDLTTFVPNLSLKMGIETLPEGGMARLTAVSHHVAELVNLPPMTQQPYVGQSAFAHKAGLHTSAIARRPDAYEHVEPALVGNGTRFLVSDLSGRATIELKAKELGMELDGAQMRAVLEELKEPGARRLPLRGGRRLAGAVDAAGHRVAQSRTSSWSRSGSSSSTDRAVPTALEPRTPWGTSRAWRPRPP